jgi:hypothetical protein
MDARARRGRYLLSGGRGAMLRDADQRRKATGAKE